MVTWQVKRSRAKKKEQQESKLNRRSRRADERRAGESPTATIRRLTREKDLLVRRITNPANLSVEENAECDFILGAAETDQPSPATDRTSPQTDDDQ